MLQLKVGIRLQTGIIVQIVFLIQAFYLFLPLSSKYDLFRVPIRDIKWLEVLIVVLLGVLSGLWILMSWLFLLPVNIPIFLMFLFILANGAMWSHVYFSATCFGITIAWGIAATWGGASVFTVGVGADVAGIGQSFLALNKFLEADPVLGQGVPSLTGALGMSSSGGVLQL